MFYFVNSVSYCCLLQHSNMVHPRMAGTVPAKLILQLTTAFREGGLSNRSGTFFFKDYLHKSEVPVLAIAADRDLICPPEAVYGKLPSSRNTSTYIALLEFVYFLLFHCFWLAIF